VAVDTGRDRVSTIVDADVLIAVLRGNASAIQSLADTRRRDDRVLSVTPVRVEVLRGVLPGEEVATDRLLGLLEWVAVDEGLADRAGELGRVYRPSHPRIEVVDLLLAAAAERLGAELLTRNVRHFPMLPELAPAF
jgi:predicted nucleic acid-binding protein